MGLNPKPTYDSVKQLVESLVQYPVYIAEIPTDKSLVFSKKTGLMHPFVVLSFGGPIRAAMDRGLVSAKHDVTILYISLDVYAGRADDAEEIKGYLFEHLTGFVPVGASELVPTGGMSYSRSSNSTRPTQYIAALSFECRGNLSSEV